MQKAFTLIELLVVILIIGILAAVALPQYRKAVEKSRVTQALAIIKSFYQAQQVYFLAHAEYATSFEQLDIDMPSYKEVEGPYGTQARSDGKWKLVLWHFEDQDGIFMSNLQSPYIGTQIGIYMKGGDPSLGIRSHVINCQENLNEELMPVYNGAPGSYCQKLLNGKLTHEGWVRLYELPE